MARTFDGALSVKLRQAARRLRTGSGRAEAEKAKRPRNIDGRWSVNGLGQYAPEQYADVDASK